LFQQAYRKKYYYPILNSKLPQVTENLQQVNNATKESPLAVIGNSFHSYTFRNYGGILRSNLGLSA
jgi:hypothetical protein